jgi:hypothetical protein
MTMDKKIVSCWVEVGIPVPLFSFLWSQHEPMEWWDVCENRYGLTVVKDNKFLL